MGWALQTRFYQAIKALPVKRARRTASNRRRAGTIQMRAGLSFIVGRTEANLMGSNIVYIVGAVVIVLAILSFFGLR
jgi:hypothetical protein